MELKQYFHTVQRWAWLLVLGLVLGGTSGYMASQLQDPVYQATTRTLVVRAPQERSSDLAYLSDQQLVKTYIELLNTQPVRDGTSVRLGYEVDEKQIKVQQTRDTQVIDVTIEDQDPRHAADIANVLVEVLIEQNETLQSGRYASTEAGIEAQIAQVEKQIGSLQLELDQISTANLQDQVREVQAQIGPLQDEVSTLQQEIAALEPALSPESKTEIAEKKARIAQIQPLLNVYQQIYSNLVVLGKPPESSSDTGSRLSQLQSTLDLYQKLYLNLLTSLESVRLARLQNTPNIVQIEPAFLPEEPIRPLPVLYTALAAVLGFIVAAATVYLIEYLDDTLRTPEDVERAIGLPVLGFVAEMQSKDKNATGPYVSQEPRSPISEAFRSLRTNLEFASVEEPIRTLLVTSPGPAEGKSTVAINLAAILALSGKRVVLLDADLRRPQVHRFLGIPNHDGLSNLFRNPALVHSVGHIKSEMPHLRIITSGCLPPNPAELLGSKKMDRILAELCKLGDVVVIDTPPSMVADAQILAGKVDAVLFVIWSGKTTSERAKASMEMFKRAGARVIGTVLNRIPRSRSFYYGGYEYFSPYNDRQGHFSANGAEPEIEQAEEPDPIKTAPLHKNPILDRTAKLCPEPEELLPPDPPKC
jgi:succinoglycan biosynthesis transport protein ExoP